MSHPITTTITLGVADADGVAQNQTLGAAGTLTLNGALVTGGVAIMDVPRRVILTSAGNDSGRTFIIAGTARSEQGGIVQSETITGGNIAAVESLLDFATVTSITGSGATAAGITAGTNGTASGPWVVWDMNLDNFKVGVYGFVLSGSPTWQVDITPDDPFGTWLPSNISAPRAVEDAVLNDLTANASGSLAMPFRASRLTLTAVGGVQLVQQQSGV